MACRGELAAMGECAGYDCAARMSASGRKRTLRRKVAGIKILGNLSFIDPEALCQQSQPS